MSSAILPRIASPIFCSGSESGAYSQASFGVMTVVTNGLACGFHWQCAANDIGYAVINSWLQHAWTSYLDSLPTPHIHGLGPPRPGGSQGRAEWKEENHRTGLIQPQFFNICYIYIYIYICRTQSPKWWRELPPVLFEESCVFKFFKISRF